MELSDLDVEFIQEVLNKKTFIELDEDTINLGLIVELIKYKNLYKKIDEMFYLNENLYTKIIKNNINKISKNYLNNLSLEQEYYFKKLLGIIYSNNLDGIMPILNIKWKNHINKMYSKENVAIELFASDFINKEQVHEINEKINNLFPICLYICKLYNKKFIATGISSHAFLILSNRIDDIKSQKKEKDDIKLNNLAKDITKVMINIFNSWSEIREEKNDRQIDKIISQIDNNLLVEPTIDVIKKDCYMVNDIIDKDFSTEPNEELKLLHEIITINNKYNIAINEYSKILGKDINFDDLKMKTEDFIKLIKSYIIGFEIETLDDIDIKLLFQYIVFANTLKDLIDSSLEDKKFAFDMINNIGSREVKLLTRNYNKLLKDYNKLNGQCTLLKEKNIELQNNQQQILTNYIPKNKEKQYLSDIANLRKQIKELKNISQEDINEELNRLREFVFNLNREIPDMNNIQETIDDYKLKIDNYLNHNELRILIVGGRISWQNDLKEILTNKKIKFINVENINFDTSIFNDISYVFFNTDYNSHGLYFKVINEVKKRNIKFNYIKNNNFYFVLKQIYKNISIN